MDGEGGALAGLAFEADGAAVGLDEGLDDGQAEAGAAGVAGAGAIGPPKALEDALLIVDRDAGSVVGDDQLGAGSVPR